MPFRSPPVFTRWGAFFLPYAPPHSDKGEKEPCQAGVHSSRTHHLREHYHKWGTKNGDKFYDYTKKRGGFTDYKDPNIINRAKNLKKLYGL